MVLRKLRVVNPRKKRSKRHSRSRSAGRRQAANPLGGGELILMSNPRKRRSRKSRRSRRGRRRNPFVSFYSRKRRNRRGSRRRRNPSRIKGIVSQLRPLQIVSAGVAAAAGALGTRAIAQMVLRDKNVGMFGYGANLVTALLLGFVTQKFTGNRALALSVGTGGAAAIFLRFWQEKVSMSAPSVSGYGLGDYDFSADGLGAYIENSHVLPSYSEMVGGNYVSSGSALPAAAAAPAAVDRLGSRFK